MEDGKQVLSVNPADSSPLTAYLPLPESSTIVLGTLQNEIAFYELGCCRLENISSVHDDRVTSLSIHREPIFNPTWCECCHFKGMCREKASRSSIIASASSDSTVKLWRVRQSDTPPHFRFRPTTDLIAELDHEFPVTCLEFSPYVFLIFIKFVFCLFFYFYLPISRNGDWLITGTAEGQLQVWEVDTALLIEELPGKHEQMASI